MGEVPNLPGVLGCEVQTEAHPPGLLRLPQTRCVSVTSIMGSAPCIPPASSHHSQSPVGWQLFVSGLVITLPSSSKAHGPLPYLICHVHSWCFYYVFT